MDGEVDNDATLENLGRVALSHARAGADLIAPSGMMDGYVGFLREIARRGGLRAGRPSSPTRRSTPPASTGRSARPPHSPPTFGDRTGYQMDPANVREAIREVALDVEEGADIDHGQARARLPRRHRRASATSSTCPSPPTTSPASTR